MSDYFDSAEKVARLREVAAEWKGTPWCANSEAKGVGVACHLLPTAILIECGALPKDFPHVKGLPRPGAKESEIVKFMDGPVGQQYFRRVLADKGESLQAGDLLGIRIRRVVDHMGLVLSEFHFAHVLMHKHTELDDVWKISPWLERTEVVWRTLQVSNLGEAQ